MNQVISSSCFEKDYSVIVPVWRGAACYLPRLLDSIPERNGIEVIVVDNSKDPLKREEINSKRDYTLLNVSCDRHAGGSRNEGIRVAKGKWLLFADADDYYSSEAFDIFYGYLDSSAEIVFTCPQGVYLDSGEYSDRGLKYSNMVHRYLDGLISEEDLRYGYSTPWAKMVSHDLVNREELKFDEIRACNDVYFSAISGYYARKIEAVRAVTYFVTVNRGSLTRLRDFEVLSARLYGLTHRNSFFKSHGLKNRQTSVMLILYQSRHFTLKQKGIMLMILWKFKQNPFIGYKNWSKSILTHRKREQKEREYIVY